VWHQKNYKKFVAQFKAAEWKHLCQHRVFLHFLKVDLRVAASVAADALQRPVTYLFPVSKKSTTNPRSKTSLRLPKLPRYRRFRL